MNFHWKSRPRFSDRRALPALEAATQAQKRVSRKGVSATAGEILDLLESALEKIASARRLLHRSVGVTIASARVIECWADNSEECARLSCEIVITQDLKAQFLGQTHATPVFDAGIRYFKDTLALLERRRSEISSRLYGLDRKLRRLAGSGIDAADAQKEEVA